MQDMGLEIIFMSCMSCTQVLHMLGNWGMVLLELNDGFGKGCHPDLHE